MTGRTGLADVLPLAPGQEGLLFHALLGTDEPDVYVVQCRFRAAGAGRVDAGRLRGAVEQLLDRHPNLRVCVRHRGLPRPVQLVPERVAVPWTEVDLTGRDPLDAQARLHEIEAADRFRRFDMTRPPLLRCTFVRFDETRADLILTLHHMLVDGWSMVILARELTELYAGRGADLPPVRPYRDHLAWLRGRDEQSAAEAWRTALAGVERPTRLARSAPGPAVPPETLDVRLSAGTTAAVRLLAEQAGVTVNTVAQAVWGLVLARATGSGDVLFGAVVSGRPPELAGVEDMVGLFINTLPVRVRLRPGEPVRALLARLQDEQSRLAGHHHRPLAEILRSTGLDALFDTLLAFENFPRGAGPGADSASGSGDATEPLALAEVRDATHFPLSLAVVAGDVLRCRLAYRPDCFEAAEAQLIAARLVHAFAVVAANPDAAADRLDVLPAEERARILAASYGPARAMESLGVPESFARQAARTPDAPAVESEAGVLTYARLAARAGALAGRLAAAGAAPETPVALLMDRAPELVIAELAVLMAGAHYVPLAPDLPEARLAVLLRESGATLAVCDAANAGLAARHGLRIIEDCETTSGPEAPRVDRQPDRGAYVMYTSGSTGTPKGVVVSHRGILDLAAEPRFATAAHARVLFHNPHTFDAATYDVWVPLLNGGTVVVAPPGRLDPARLSAVVARHRVTALFLTAELFRTLADVAPELPASLRELWVGGDVVAPDAVRRVQQASTGLIVVDGYGPTETTTFATCHTIERPAGAGPVPLGAPLQNTGAHVLDARLRPVPLGAVGELYLTGPGLARGYLGQPARTAERFVAAPSGPGLGLEPGSRMYRTGDLAFRGADGRLHFAGRTDGQVKIRGVRIEPAEVESVLESCPGVERAVAGARPHPAGGARLVAWLRLGPGGDLDRVRAHAALRLPAAFLPSAYVPIDEIPRTRHGKVDQAALPDPSQAASPRSGRAARTGREEELCRLFATSLGRPDFGPEQSFFDAGGHSLLAMRLAAAIEARFDTRVPVGALFLAPSPAALAERLELATANPGFAPLLPLRAEGERTPLFCVHAGLGLGWSFSNLLPHLAPGHPVYALQTSAVREGGAGPADVADLARTYLERIRAIQPQGPYLLLGWSFGGLVAYEMAALLERNGERAGLAAVLDTVPVRAVHDDSDAAASDDTTPVSIEAAEDGIEQHALRVLLSTNPLTTLSGRLDRAAVFESVRSHGTLRDEGDHRLAALTDACARFLTLAREYHPSRYDGRITLLSATTGSPLTTEQKAAAWRRSCADLVVHEIDCAHRDVMTPAPAAHVAAVLNASLKEF